MKQATFFLLFILFGNLATCFGQVRDSVCVHILDRNMQPWPVRKIDTAEFGRYGLNTPYFSKMLRHDTMYIRQAKYWYCIPETVFIGEYTSADSIHFIDFAEIKGVITELHFENICGRNISRNQLPLIKKLIFQPTPEFSFYSCTMYVVPASGAGVTESFFIETAELPDAVRKSILKLSNGGSITLDNVKILGPDGKRTIDEVIFLINN